MIEGNVETREEVVIVGRIGSWITRRQNSRVDGVVVVTHQSRSVPTLSKFKGKIFLCVDKWRLVVHSPGGAEVSAREDAHPTWATWSGLYEALVESSAFTRKGIQVRCLHNWMSVDAQTVGPELVRQYEQDVLSLCHWIDIPGK